MKNVKKNLFGIGMAFSMMLGIGFSFVPQDAGATSIATGRGELYGDASVTRYCCKGSDTSDCEAAPCKSYVELAFE